MNWVSHACSLLFCNLECRMQNALQNGKKSNFFVAAQFTSACLQLYIYIFLAFILLSMLSPDIFVRFTNLHSEMQKASSMASANCAKFAEFEHLQCCTRMLSISTAVLIFGLYSVHSCSNQHRFNTVVVCIISISVQISVLCTSVLYLGLCTKLAALHRLAYLSSVQ